MGVRSDKGRLIDWEPLWPFRMSNGLLRALHTVSAGTGSHSLNAFVQGSIDSICRFEPWLKCDTVRAMRRGPFGACLLLICPVLSERRADAQFTDFFLQLALEVDKDPKPQPSEIQVFQAQLRSKSFQALRWKSLRLFPAQWQQLDLQCSNIGRRFPQLTSRNSSLLEKYRHYACQVASDYFVTDPDVALSVEVAALENGCVNVLAKPLVMMATNGTHGYNAYRKCSGSCPDDPSWQEMAVESVDEDILVLPSIRTIPGMEYQHSLTDLLAQAWTVLPLLTDMKLVIYHPIQRQLLEAMGIPSEQLLEMPIRSFEERKLLCVKPGRSMTLWRTARADGADLPVLSTKDERIYADFWWRLPGYRLVPEVSDAIARHSKLASSLPNSVIFVQRCSQRRELANEPEAVGAVTRVLVDSKIDFQLLTFCPGREDFLEQVRKVRQAKLIIGEHGGALANMLLARNGTGVIELVGSPEAQIGVQGQFPPYKSMWYGGAGTAFAFYRVVLYEPIADGLAVRLEDLQEAVQQWLGS